jgi:uncharacterized membrane protein YccC
MADRSAAGWLRARDPGLLAVKRSVRAAVVMPAAFAFAHLTFASGQVGLFAAFGAFALLLLVDFPGPPRVRLASYLGLMAVGAAFVTVGTAVSTHQAAAVVVMAVVGFAVLFAGIVSPQLATAATAALLTFVLPVAVAQPDSAIGDRLLGLLIAGVFSVTACMLVWPTPWHDDLRRRLSAAVAAVGRVARARADARPDPALRSAMATELDLLKKQFQGTTYPPTGAATTAMALAKLVGRVEWVAGSALLVGDDVAVDPAPVRAVVGAVADTLEGCASLVCDGAGRPVGDPVIVDAVRASTHRLDHLMTAELDAEVTKLIDPDALPADPAPGTGPDDAGGGIAAVLDPSFRARALGVATEMVSDATLQAAGAQAASDRRLGPPGGTTPATAWNRVVSHLSFRSVWFRNALRGAAGLALAVAVVEVSDVEHGFWVVLGTLSVLRSNALGTGATAARAVAGTTIGFVIGAAIMIGVGGHSDLLWALLPLAVLVSGVAPSMISFAAGQAGFTVVVVILFNIISPVGWKVGLTRIEDVAIGCGVSIVVGVLFWPRGATAALGSALSDAFVANSAYLADAVERLTASTRTVDVGPAARTSHRAYLRLDDAYRQFLTERGAKVVPVEAVARLTTGSNRIRMAAYTLTNLPVPGTDPDHPELESVAVAGAVLRDAYAASHRWYQEFAELLADRRQVLDPPPVHDRTLHDVLRAAFEDARAHHRADRLRTTLQMLWADELLETQGRVQADLAGSAELFVHRGHGLLPV